MNKSGFALVEVLVAALLLVGVSAVAFSAFSSSAKVQQTPTNSAANVARGTLDQLFEYVRADQWTPGSTPTQRLDPANAARPPFPATVLNGVTYTPTYTVVSKDADGGGDPDDYRKADVTITW